jgi:membrane associated rhomboid family serine protease
MNNYINKIRRKVGFSYEKNVSLRLVLTLAGFYIGLQALYIIIMVLSKNQVQALTSLYLPEIALQDAQILITKPWTIFTYFLFHISFFEFATNMLWLYLFSIVIQNLIGYKEIIPLFLSTTILGGVVFIILNSITNFPGQIFTVGSFAGVMGIAVACTVLAPKYKFYLSESLSFPIWVAFLIYTTLNIISFSSINPKLILLLVSGGIIGTTYMLMVKNGIKIGTIIYQMLTKLFKFTGANPEINKEGTDASKMVLNQKDDAIDTILDKIHQKGLLSLTQEEKNTLEQFSKKI